MNYRYVYKPEVHDIYLYKGKPVIVYDASWGHYSFSDLQCKEFDVLKEYSDEADELFEKKIGKIIKPRWNKEYQTWETLQRGLRYEQTIHNGSGERY